MLIYDDPRFMRAERLEQTLKAELGSSPRFDWLSRYRVWLDERGIDSETDGWPNERAYEDANVKGFIASVIESRGP